MKIFNYYITKNNPRDLLNQLREKEDIINKAIEELYIWSETLSPEFQKRMLEILDNKGEDKNE